MKNKRKLSAFAAITVLLTTLMALGSVMVPSTNAQPMVEVQISGQLNICHPPNPCVMATLEAHAMGPLDDLHGHEKGHSLTGRHTQGKSFTDCDADVTGYLTLSPVAPPIVTLIGTLYPQSSPPAGQQCVANLAGVTVTLVGDSSNGAITLTAPAGDPNAPPETIGFTYGTVIIQYTQQTSTTT